MNWLDFLLLAILLLHLISGYVRGLVLQFFDIFGFLVVIILSFWGSRLFSGSLAVLIDPEDIIPHHDLIQQIGLEVALEKVPQIVAGIVTFLLLMLFLSLIFRLFSGGLRWVNRVPIIGFLNRIGGLLLGALVGLVFVYIIITALNMVPLRFFIDSLKASEVAFIMNYYISPFAGSLSRLLLEYLVNLNSADWIMNQKG